MNYDTLKENLNKLLEGATDKGEIDLITASLTEVEMAKTEFERLAKDNVEYAKAYKQAVLAKSFPPQGGSEEKGVDPTLKDEPKMPDFEAILAEKMKGK